jgi:hypothetical protein
MKVIDWIILFLSNQYMSIEALKTRLEDITRKPPVGKDILSLIQSINKTGVASLQKSMRRFTNKDLTKKQRKEFMNVVHTENRRRTIRRGKPGIKPSVFKKIRENRNPKPNRNASRLNASRSRAYRSRASLSRAYR